MSGSSEVSEDSFEFTPIVFIWAFDTCGEEGDDHLDILPSLFAEEPELGNLVGEGLGLFFWQEFGITFVSY